MDQPDEQDSIEFRPACADDVPALVALERANMQSLVETHYPGTWSDLRAAKTIQENLQRTTVAVRKGRLLGFYCWQTDKEHGAGLHSIQVAASKQGRGFGTQMMNSFEKEVSEQGIGSIVLAVHDGNPARRLYERRGYRVIDSDGPHAWLLRKDLENAGR